MLFKTYANYLECEHIPTAHGKFSDLETCDTSQQPKNLAAFWISQLFGTFPTRRDHLELIKITKKMSLVMTNFQS